MSNSKAYKDGTIRIHYKGERDAHGFTTGNRLSGAKIDRGSWSRDQKAISRSLSARLQKDPDFTSAPNSSGSHGSEIAHARPQSEGGMTDELGAQPASWHFNVGDMAREEGQVELANKLGDNVRMKSTVYMHSEGPKVGTIKARRHKIYIRKDPSSPWGKKFDHLQDGHRGDIDKSEVKTLKTRIENLKADSPDVSLHHKKTQKGIPEKANISGQKTFIPPANDSRHSPYFTDILDQNKLRKSGQEAHETVVGLNQTAAKAIELRGKHKCSNT